MSDPNKIEYAKREVIHGKLLAALEDDNVVACVFTEEDLDDLIEALYRAKFDTKRSTTQSQDDLLESLRQLRREAFGN